MPTMTNYRVETLDGDKIRADPWGLNVAFECLDDECKHPVIATASGNTNIDRGFKEAKPAECRNKKCKWRYRIEICKETETVKVRKITSDE